LRKPGAQCFLYSLLVACALTAAAPALARRSRPEPSAAVAGAIQLAVQIGHGQPVASGAVSPDQRLIVTGADEGAILWEARTGRELRRVAGIRVSAVGFLPDSRQFWTKDWSGVIQFWDVETGQQKRRLKLPALSIDFSRDGRLILAGDAEQGRVALYDAESGRVVRTFSGPFGSVDAVALSADGRLVVCGGSDRIVRLFDAATGSPLRSLSGHAMQLQSAALSPDGRLLLTSDSSQRSARLWDTATGRQLVLYHSPAGKAGMDFSPDGKLAVVTTLQGAEILAAPDWQPVRVIKSPSVHGFSFARFSPDGLRLLTGSSDETARLWEVASGRELLLLASRSAAISQVRFSASGRLALSGSENGAIHVWDLESGRERQTLRWPAKVGGVGGDGMVHQLTFSPDERYIVARTGNVVRVFDTQSGQQIRELKSERTHLCCTFSADGRLAADVPSGRLFDVLSGRVVRERLLKDTTLRRLAFSPDGRLFLGVCYDGSVRLVETESGRELRRWKFGEVFLTVFLPNGQLLFNPSEGKFIRYDTKREKDLPPFREKTGVSSAAASPDSKYLLLGDNLGRLWRMDAASGKAQQLPS
jgi:WD40 repeat protein